MFQPISLAGKIDRSAPTMPEDVLATKSALSRLGRYTPHRGTITPHTDEPMFDGILAFQRDRGLLEDGIMKSEGPTAKSINADLWRAENPTMPTVFTLGRGIGQGAENAPRDVANARNALAWASFFPADKTAGNTDPNDPEFRIGIARFQRAFNLMRDGIMRPRGETERTLASVVSPLVGVHNMRQRRQSEGTGAQLTAAETRAGQATTDEPAVRALSDRAGKFVPGPAAPKPAAEQPKDEAGGSSGYWSTDYEKQDPFIASRIPQNRRGEWDAMAAATERAKLGNGERRAYMEIFNAEGGTKPDGTTASGITVETLREFKTKVLMDGDISPSALPKDLTDDQRVYVYRAYLNQSHVLLDVGGSDALNSLNDSEAAAAIADTLFRDGGFGGMSAVRRAVNAIVPGTLPDGDLDRKSTFGAFASLAGNVATRQKVLNALAEERLKLKPRELQRIDHFRFQR